MTALWIRRPRNLGSFPEGIRELYLLWNFQTVTRAHRSCCSLRTGGFFSEGIAVGAWSWPHLYLVPWLRIIAVIRPLLLMTSWRLQGQLYSYLHCYWLLWLLSKQAVFIIGRATYSLQLLQWVTSEPVMKNACAIPHRVAPILLCRCAEHETCTICDVLLPPVVSGLLSHNPRIWHFT